MAFTGLICYNLNVMRNHFSHSFPLWFHRTTAFFLVLTALFAYPAKSDADDGLFAVGSCSDDVQRAETRLSDLGYDRSVVDGRWDQADADAFSAFATVNGVTAAAASDLLYSNDALAASQHGGTVFASGTQGFLITYGTLMPAPDVAARLVAGQSYDITSCYSGVTLHMVCVSMDSHAKMRPELDWDNATLRGFFSSSSSSEKQPVVLTVDGILVAASIQQAAPNITGETLPVYSVYFHNSLTAINGIADAEHEEIVRIAANQQ